MSSANGGDLRLDAGEAPQLQILQPDIVADRLGHAVRAIAAERRAVPVGERAVVLDQAFERFPGQVEAVEGRVAALQRRHHPQGLGVVIEAAEGAQAIVERALAGMAERRMTEVVGQRQRLGEVLVEAERAGQRARDLRDFERVGQPRAVMIALVEHEHLGLVLEAAEGGRMDDAVAVAAKRAAAFAGRLRMKPAAALARIAGIGRADCCGVDRHRSARLSAIDLGI